MPSMSSNTVYLITGVNRGIGRGIAATLLTRPNITVIGCVRDPDSFDSDFHVAETSKLIVQTISSGSETDAATAIASVQQSHGVLHIDVLIANAGTGTVFNTALDTPVSELRHNFEINTLGPIKLFQAAWPLLAKSKDPKFVYVSSSLGSIELMEPVPDLAYGVSKAAANFFVRKVHSEHKDVVAFAIHPGWAKTANGQAFADSIGVSAPPLSVDDSVAGVLAQIDASTRDKSSGKFLSYDGTSIPW
ncbi:aflatoxin biosynthesis ketoreductase nor-1 [Phlyctema vagabunda]|uniref:Aflatoxin biosynthesis ketoreductase nor-1 n=1 Tax=Phlyctema vagabunda TaxID=108571 RepID=A0ABR4PVL0_9HELO